MAGQGPNTTYNSGQIPGQAQMRKDEILSNLSNQGQGSNFLQETGTQVKNMAQGAADVGKGAAQAAINIARGAAIGAANMAQGTGEAIKNTLGANNTDTTTTTTGRSGTNNPAMNFGGTAADIDLFGNAADNMGGSTYPTTNPTTNFGGTAADIDLFGNAADDRMGGSAYPGTNSNRAGNPSTKFD